MTGSDDAQSGDDWREHAEHLMKHGDLDAAVEYLISIRPTLTSESEPVNFDLASCLLTLGMALLYGDRMEESLPVLLDAQQQFETLGRPDGVAQCDWLYAEALDSLDQLEDAADAYQRALSFYRDMGKREHSADCLRRLADIAVETGDYLDALKMHQQSLDAFLALGKESKIGEIYMNMAVACECTGKFSVAAKHLEDAAENFSRFNREDDARGAAAMASEMRMREASNAESNRGLHEEFTRWLYEKYQEDGDEFTLNSLVDAAKALTNQPAASNQGKAEALRNAGSALLLRFEKKGDAEDLDSAQGLFDHAVQLSEPHSSESRLAVSSLAACLIELASQRRDITSLDRAITMLRDASHGSADDPSRAILHFNLGRALSTRHDLSSRADDLRDAISEYRVSKTLSPDDIDLQTAIDGNLAMVLCTDASLSRDRESELQTLSRLREARKLAEQAVESTRQHDPYYVSRLSCLGIIHVRIYEVSGDLCELNLGISTHERAVKIMEQSNPLRARLLANLGNAAFARYREQGEIDDLGMAIVSVCTSIRLMPLDSALYRKLLDDLRRGVRSRWRETRRLSDYQQAVGCFENLAESESQIPADCRALLEDLRRELLTRRVSEPVQDDPPDSVAGDEDEADSYADLVGQLRDPAKAIERLREEMDRAPDSAMLLLNLGALLVTYYQQSNDASLLDEAIEVLDLGRANVSKGGVEDNGIVLNLGAALIGRFDLHGDDNDLDRCLQIAGEIASRPASEANSQFASFLNQLAVRVGFGSERVRDLDTAINLSEAAVAAGDCGQSEWIDRRNNLATFLGLRFESLHQKDDLNRAIDHFQFVVKNTSVDDPDESERHVNAHVNLGMYLHARYRLESDRADLLRARDSLLAAISAVDSSSDVYATAVNNYSNVVLSFNKLDPNSADLTQALQWMSDVLEQEHLEPEDRAIYLITYANLSHKRYEASQIMLYKVRAKESLEEALSLLPESSQHRDTIRSNLAALGEGVEGEPDRPSSEPLTRAIQLHNLAISKFEMARESAAGDGITHVWQLFEDAIELFGPKNCYEVFNTADNWLSRAWQCQDFSQVARAFHHFRSAYDALVSSHSLGNERVGLLRRVQGVSSKVAYSFAKIDDLNNAHLAFEWGKAQLVSNRLNRRDPRLRLLESRDEELFRRYWATNRAIESLERQDYEKSESVASDTDLVVADKKLRQELDEIMSQIRSMEGFEDFARPAAMVNPEILRESLDPSVAVALIAPTSLGTMILVETRDCVETLFLDVCESDFQRLLFSGGRKASDTGLLVSQIWRHDLLDMELNNALPRLGRSLMAPLASRLRELGVENVAIVPSGLVSLLPIHAACYERPKGRRGMMAWMRKPRPGLSTASGDGRQVAGSRNGTLCFFDEFVVTILPRPQQIALPRCETDAKPMHFVGFADCANLRAAEAEVLGIAESITSTSVVFGDRDVRRSEWQPHLRKATHLHFACHAELDPDDFFESYIQINRNEQLTLADFYHGDLQLDDALVVLSSCKTAITEYDAIPNENFGIPAALLTSGARAVICALWIVHDIWSATLMFKFYDLFLAHDVKDGIGDPFSVARGLRDAQVWLRDATQDELIDFFEQLSERTSCAEVKEFAAARMVGARSGNFQARPEHWASFVYWGA